MTPVSSLEIRGATQTRHYDVDENLENLENVQPDVSRTTSSQPDGSKTSQRRFDSHDNRAKVPKTSKAVTNACDMPAPPRDASTRWLHEHTHDVV
eukprot:6348384-Amphidinium_carterae.1